LIANRPLTAKPVLADALAAGDLPSADERPAAGM
jgi:hypothetical protein